jgi:hypothetical protein
MISLVCLIVRDWSFHVFSTRPAVQTVVLNAWCYFLTESVDPKVDSADVLKVKRILESKARLAQVQYVEEKGLLFLAQQLSTNKTVILELELPAAAFRAPVADAMVKGITQNSALRKLGLRSCGLGDTELRVLLTALKANVGLKRVDLDNNKFSEETGRELLAVFKEHKTLVRADLYGCRLSPALVSEFAIFSRSHIDAGLVAFFLFFLLCDFRPHLEFGCSPQTS